MKTLLILIGTVAFVLGVSVLLSRLRRKPPHHKDEAVTLTIVPGPVEEQGDTDGAHPD